MTGYGKTTAISIALHAAIIVAIASAASVQGCRMKKQPLEIVDFTIAVEPAGEPEPEPPKPDPPKEQKKPDPPKPDDIAVKQQKKEQKKPDPPKEQKKPDPPKPIKKGRRINAPVESKVTPKEKQTLTDEEIKKWLGKRAKIGETTSLPTNERSLNVSILVNSLYEAWLPPPASASGSRPATVEFGIASDGTLLNPRIVESSGSPAYDQTCLDACRRVGRISGLTASFIREYGTACPVEFRRKE